MKCLQLVESDQSVRDYPDIMEALVPNQDPNAELFLARFYKFSHSTADENNLAACPIPVTPPPATSAPPVPNPNSSNKKRGASAKRSICFGAGASQSPAKRVRPERQRVTPAKLTKTPSPASYVKPVSGRRQSGRSSQTRSATPLSVSVAPLVSPVPTLPSVPRVSVLRLRLPLDDKGDRTRTAPVASPSTGGGTTTTGLSSSSPFSSSTSPSSNVTVEAREHTQAPSRLTTTTASVSLTSSQSVSTTTATVTPITDPLRITIRQVTTPTRTDEGIVSNGDSGAGTESIVALDASGEAATATRETVSTPRSLFSINANTMSGVGRLCLSARKRSTAVVTPMRQESEPPRELTTPEKAGDGKGVVNLSHCQIKTSKPVGGQLSAKSGLSNAKRSSIGGKKRVDHVDQLRLNSKKNRHKRRLSSLVIGSDNSDDEYAKQKSKRLPHFLNASRKTSRRMPNTSPFSTQSSPVDDTGESDGFPQPPSLSSSILGTVSKTDLNTANSLESPGRSSLSKPSTDRFSASPVPPTSSGGPVGATSVVRQQQQERQLKELDAEARLLLIDRAIKSSLVRGNEDVATCVDRLEMLDRMVLTLPVIAKCWTVVETIRKCRRYKRSMEVKIAAQRVFNKFIQVYACADKFEMELAHKELLRLQQRFVSTSTSMAPSQTTDRGQSQDTGYCGPKSMADLFQVSATTLAERRRQSSVAESVGARSSEQASLANYQMLALDDIPLPEESGTATTSESLGQGVRKTSSDESVVTLVTSPLASQQEMVEEFEVLDEYDEEKQEFLSGQLQDEYSKEQRQEEQPSGDEKQSIDEDDTEEGEVRDSGVSPPHQSRPSPSHYPTSTHNFLQDAPMSDGVGDPPVSYVPQPPHYYQSAMSDPGISIERTPPQMASRAYIPHSLHPSNEPPPPYRPYLPNYVDRSRPVAFARDDDPRDRRERRHHTGSGSPSTAAGSKEAVDPEQRLFRSPLPLDSVPPHRARSPHALPHPLEHYQRCLTTALVSDEEEAPVDRHSRAHHRHASRKYSAGDDPTGGGRPPPSDAPGNPNGQVAGKQASCVEDLDTRIARMLNSQSTSPQDPSLVLEPGHTLGSPPPPPPPLPPSHRVIFTHRPPPPPYHNFQKHRLPMAGPPSAYQHRMPGYRRHPPPGVGPLHRASSGPTTYFRDNRMHFIGGGPDCPPPPVACSQLAHHPRAQRESADAPHSSAYNRTFHSPQPYPVNNRNRRGSGQEKDREIYSMLGV